MAANVSQCFTVVIDFSFNSVYTLAADCPLSMSCGNTNINNICVQHNLNLKDTRKTHDDLLYIGMPARLTLYKVLDWA